MITLFFRHKIEGVNSIEMVFANLDAKLAGHKNRYIPHVGASPKAIIGNLIFAYKNKTEINHITGDIQYIALTTGSNTILTVHDVQSAIYGPWYKRFVLKLLWFWLPALIVKKITVISEFTKKELSRIVPFAKKKIEVIPNAFNPRIGFVEKCIDKHCPVILHIGTNSNKNLERVIQALEGMNCKLVIVGKLSAGQQALLKQASFAYTNCFDIDYSQIVKLYQECDIVSFPSTYEGFGVPILEANAAGRPVLVGDIPVLHEVGANAALFVNPYDVSNIKQGFRSLIDDDDLRMTLIRNGRSNIQRFSPEVIAEKYNELYRSLSK